MSTLQAPSCHASGISFDPAIPQRSLQPALWMFAGACILSLAAVMALQIDRSVALWFKNHRLPSDLAHLLRLSEVFGWGGGVSVIILTIAILDSRGWRLVPKLAIASLGTGLAADVIKLFIARTRPSATPYDATSLETFVAAFPGFYAATLESGHGHQVQSFPSAHAATAVGLAICLSSLYPRGKWLFAAFAVLAVVQRIEADAHYCSDVLAGSALAFALAGIYSWFRKTSSGCESRHREVG